LFKRGAIVPDDDTDLQDRPPMYEVLIDKNLLKGPILSDLLRNSLITLEDLNGCSLLYKYLGPFSKYGVDSVRKHNES
jgi:hypothetical protein